VQDRYDSLVVGGGSAGCVLAARLSEDPGRSVCLLEAGPDYGPHAGGRWPPELLDPRALVFTHDWGTGGEDERSLGARVIGGCSTHNACLVLEGTPADYDEWGSGWSYTELSPYLDRTRAALRTARANTEQPAPLHSAFIGAAQQVGFPLIDDPSDPEQPLGIAPYPANVVDGVRWNAAFAYLDPVRTRPNLTVAGDALVDRVLLEGTRAIGVCLADGRRVGADAVVLSAGAYFTPAILLRSGIGPGNELRRHGIPTIVELPVGERLLDHCGSGVAWEPTDRLHELTARHVREHGGLFEPHAVLKAASGSCPEGSFDIHLLPWTNAVRGTSDRFEASCAVFHMKPLSAGRLGLRSADPADLPHVERGFLDREEDTAVIVEGIELTRALAASEPLRELVADELRPADRDLREYVVASVRNYFHPAGTCALGTVTDASGRVFGTEGLVVADASVMPTIPRANTHLTALALADRIADTLV
jgi:choline dehydrogenase